MFDKINALLLPAEKTKLALHAVLGLFIALLDIAFLAGTMFLAGMQAARPAIAKILSQNITEFSSNHLIYIVLITVLLFAFKNLAGHRITSVQYHYAYQIGVRISRIRLLRFLKGNYTSYIHIDSAVFLYQIANQPIEIAQYVVLPLQQIFVQGMLLTVSSTAMLIYRPGLMLLMALFILPAAALISLWIKNQTRSIRQNIRHNSQKSTQHLKEALSGFVESNIFGKDEFLAQRYTEAQYALNRDLAEVQSTQSKISRTFETAAIGVILLYLLLCSRYPSCC